MEDSQINFTEESKIESIETESAKIFEKQIEEEISIPKHQWLALAMKKHPDALELRERTHPLTKVQSFSKLFLSDKTEAKYHLSNELMVELLLQHLQFLGLKKSMQTLQEESNIKCPKSHLKKSRLQALLQIGLNTPNQLWEMGLPDMLNEQSIEFLENFEEQQEEEENSQNNIPFWEEPIRPGENISFTESNNEREPQIIKAATKLIERYHVPKLKSTTEEEYTTKKKAIQLRVINVLKLWIESHFSDFNPRLIHDISLFVDNTLVKDKYISLAKHLRNAIANKIDGKNTDGLATNLEMPPEPKVPKNIFSPKMTFFDIDEEEIARQMTLAEFSIFSTIQSKELLNQAWNKPKLKHRAPNVLRMIYRFNDIALQVATAIILPTKVRDRSRTLAKFIRVAEHLKALNNYNTLMALIAGINSTPVHRLKQTWTEIPYRSYEIFNGLLDLMSSNSSYKNYRTSLRNSVPPCIPYLGIYLTDLTFTEDGSPDFIDNLINFSKRRLICDYILEIQQLQQLGYNLQPVLQIQNFLEKFPKLSEEELYKKSLEVEPREQTISTN
ncbi:ras guanine nucleotide exchange factor i-related [Anaeramoeba ignava]|uniref:Ras guanine nucleotide exchange factor i-related n=1 Tax=Anaeramoeba ignava TaxID=1746090 RepID=A0A9Q0RBF8_ANAIG|nr:ras guanine nucleotide exchange factor i-related [Anaeramoeba ignava]